MGVELVVAKTRWNLTCLGGRRGGKKMGILSTFQPLNWEKKSSVPSLRTKAVFVSLAESGVV